VADLGPGRGRASCGPHWRPGLPGLTSHRKRPGATATMWHCCGPDHHDVTSWRLTRRVGRAGAGEQACRRMPGTWGAGPCGPMHSHAALAAASQGLRWAEDDVLGGLVKVAAVAG